MLCVVCCRLLFANCAVVPVAVAIVVFVVVDVVCVVSWLPCLLSLLLLWDVSAAVRIVVFVGCCDCWCLSLLFLMTFLLLIFFFVLCCGLSLFVVVWPSRWYCLSPIVA